MYNRNTSTANLRDDLRLYECSIKWKMLFNPERTKPAEKAIFTNRISTSYETMVYSGVDVILVDYHKYLGFMFDRSMNSIKHIDGKIAKANQGMSY